MALREINIIPEEILARRNLLRHLSFWLGCLVVSLALIWGSYFLQDHILLAKRHGMSKLEDMHTNLGTKIDEIKMIQEELQRLSQQQAVLETITTNESYSRICARLADIMNESTWLTQLAIENNHAREKNIEISVRLTGFSFSNDDLGDFLNHLSSDGMFEKVILKHATESQISRWDQSVQGSVKLIHFQIDCSIPKV